MKNRANPRVMLRRRRTGESGFTLIELLVVIAVLAILAAIVLFNVVGVSNRGKSSACATDVSTVQNAVDAYYADHGDFPAGDSGNADAMIGDLTGAQPPYLHALNGKGQSNTNCTTSFTISAIGGDSKNGYTVAGN
ncbi:MAG TPA: prepilin-type N-terminal cleavage/methylation domain-containing protein [Candidatus Angelobacter sp.]|nr:prepilin-type N-terminal cleavage/methylation domain-containing protein [Candidatus Angelobacter sp.]